jgi:hypothetical protein
VAAIERLGQAMAALNSINHAFKPVFKQDFK